jgi:hypothetical protein
MSVTPPLPSRTATPPAGPPVGGNVRGPSTQGFTAPVNIPRQPLQGNARSSPSGVWHGLRSIRWFRLFLAIAWEAAGLGFLALIYLLVTSQGLTELSPPIFGQRLARLPGFGWLANYQGWHRLTVGHVGAMGLMVFVAVAWFLLARDWLLTQGNKLDAAQWNLRNARVFWRVAGLGLLFADGVLFFRGLVEMSSWTASPSYFSAFVLTVVYLCALMVFSFVSVLLWSHVRRVES